MAPRRRGLEFALSRQGWELLEVAADQLTDAFALDVAALEDGGSFAGTAMAEYVPPAHLGYCYDLAFARGFHRVVEEVAEKLRRARGEGWDYPWHGPRPQAPHSGEH